MSSPIVSIPAAQEARPKEQNFYLGMSLVLALIVFAGFSRTYFLRDLALLPPLSWGQHLHGAVFTGWIALFITQTALVRTGNQRWHRRLGVAGVLLSAAMLIVGVSVSIESTQAALHGLRPATLRLPPLQFLAVQLGTLLLFGGLVAAAVLFRRDRNTHRRLMLLATIAIIPPAIARLHLAPFGLQSALLPQALAYLLVLLCMAHDLLRTGRIHPAYLWGGGSMIGWVLARQALVGADLVQAAMRMLVS